MIDAVITELELQVESQYHPYGHFICLRFIDMLIEKIQEK